VIGALCLLLLFQLAGEVVSQALALPVPGPALGMAMLFAALAVRGGPAEAFRDTTNGLLRHLSLLFVPAGAGVMLHGARLGQEWLPIVGALVGSTAIAVVATGLTLRWLTARDDKQP